MLALMIAARAMLAVGGQRLNASNALAAIMSGNWVAAALVHTQSEHSHPPAGGLPPYALSSLLRSSNVPSAHTLAPLLFRCDMKAQLA